MKRAHIAATIFLVLGLGLTLFILLAAPIPLEIKMRVAMGLGIVFLYMGAAIVFLMALKGYKYKLRLAYRYICTSMFLISFGTLEFFVLGATGALDSIWVTQTATLPFILMATLAYFGVRIFARLVDVKSMLTNIKVGLGIALGVGVLASVAVSLATSSSLLDFSTVTHGYQGALFAMAAIFMFNIRRITGHLYASALGWNAAFYVIAATSEVTGFIVSLLSLPETHWYYHYNISSVPYFIGGLCLMMAALQFNRIAYTEKIKSITTSAANKEKQAPANPVDVVIFMAGLASSPARLDPILDEVRVITSGLGPDKKLTDTQQQSLATVYLKLEDFLINKETVRAYKQADLRQMVELRFNEMTSGQFWQKVKSA